jgi:ATP/maltotriose-dependent transcriptional regulator MalT
MEDIYHHRELQMCNEHPYTLLALCYLSKIYIEQGELRKAEESLVEGVAAGRRSLGEDHLGVLVGCGELTRVFARQGRLDEAKALSLETVRKIKISRGDEHSDFAYGVWKLGELWEKKEEQAKAINAYRIAITAIERRQTANHPLYQIISDRIMRLTETSDSNDPKDRYVANSSTEAKLEIKRFQPTQTWYIEPCPTRILMDRVELLLCSQHPES